LSASPVTELPLGRVPAFFPHQLARTDSEFLNTFANWLRREDVGPASATKDPSRQLPKARATEYSTASTANRDDLELGRKELWRLSKSAQEMLFEDGEETPFSKDLVSFIQRYGGIGVSLLGELALSETVSDEVISEALRWIGRMDDTRTRWFRLRLLEELLNCESPKIRDGASLGIASLDDQHAIVYLQKAHNRERITDLRKDLQLVLTRLQRNR